MSVSAFVIGLAIVSGLIVVAIIVLAGVADLIEMIVLPDDDDADSASDSTMRK